MTIFLSSSKCLTFRVDWPRQGPGTFYLPPNWSIPQKVRSSSRPKSSKFIPPKSSKFIPPKSSKFIPPKKFEVHPPKSSKFIPPKKFEVHPPKTFEVHPAQKVRSSSPQKVRSSSRSKSSPPKSSKCRNSGSEQRTGPLSIMCQCEAKGPEGSPPYSAHASASAAKRKERRVCKSKSMLGGVRVLQKDTAMYPLYHENWGVQS